MKKRNINPAPLLRREFLQIYGGALAAAVLSGCGGGRSSLPLPGGSPTPTPTPASSPTPTPTPTGGGGDNGIVVRPEVTLLPADGSVEIGDLGGGAFRLRGAPTTVTVGSVLVSAAGVGLLRKVTAVQSPLADGSVRVETVQGTLEDVFIKAAFHTRLPITAADVARIETAEDITYIGPAVGGAGLSRTVHEGRDVTTLASFEFALKSTALMDAAEAEFNGKAKLKIEMEIDGSIEDGTVQSFTCLFHVTPAAEVEFVARKKFSKSLFKMPYATIYLNSIIFAIGVVPVVVVPKIDISAEMVGAVEGGVSFACAVGAPTTVGAKYTAAGGWDGVATTQVTGSLVPKANAFASIKIEFNPVRVDVQAHLYGVAGPQITLVAPGFEVKLAGKLGSDNSVKFTGAVAAKAGVTMEVEVVGKELASYTRKDALEFKDILFEKTFLPGDAEVEVL